MKKGLVRISALFFSTFFRFKTVWSAKMENRLRFKRRSNLQAFLCQQVWLSCFQTLLKRFFQTLLPHTQRPRLCPPAWGLLPLSF